MQCPKCSGSLTRSHRRGIEKWLFSQKFRCAECSYRTGTLRFEKGLWSAHAVCPHCGNPNPDRRAKRDQIDRMLVTPYRMLHKLLGGKLYHCVYCRLQFHDLRRKAPGAKKRDTQPVNTATTVS